MEVPDLTDAQATKILEKGIALELYESPNNVPPVDAETRMKDAQRLVEVAERARNAGNNGVKVNEVLALVGTTAETPAIPEMEPVVSESSVPIPAPSTDSHVVNGLDLSTVSDEVLDKLIEQSDGYVQTPNVVAQKAIFEAEKKERESKNAPAEQIVETAKASPTQANSSVGVATPPSEEPVADAGSFAPAQTPETPKERRKPKAKSATKGGPTAEREALLTQLNFGVLQAWGVSALELDNLNDGQLKAMISNPDGPTDETVMETPAQPAVVPEPVESERERLEAQITGPMLKAYGRGRKELATIGETELALMIANPEGAPSAEVDTARLSDSGVETSEDSPEPSFAEMLKAAESEAEVQAQVEEKPATPPAIAPVVAVPVPTSDPRTTVDDIIAKNNFPLPAEISGDPPFLPNDVSNVSRNELYSFHARFHACESRANWIISRHEDQYEDNVKLRTGREAEVYAALPAVGDDGKRLTESQREALVAVDSVVVGYKDKEHEEKKVLRNLKVLRDNYKRDCERLSRQMSKYEMELKSS